MHKQVFVFGGGVVVTALSILVPAYSILWICVLIFGCLLMLGSAIDFVRSKPEWIKQHMEPWHLQVIGLAGIVLSAAIALGGVFWQQRTTPSTTNDIPSKMMELKGPPAQLSSAPEQIRPKRHLSVQDKDYLAGSLSELSDITENKLRKTLVNVEGAIKTWHDSTPEARTSFVPEMQKTLKQSGTDVQSILKYIREVWVQRDQLNKDELVAVLNVDGEQPPMSVIESYSGAVWDFSSALDQYLKLAPKEATPEIQESAFQLAKSATSKLELATHELRICVNNLAYRIKTARDAL